MEISYSYIITLNLIYFKYNIFLSVRIEKHWHHIYLASIPCSAQSPAMNFIHIAILQTYKKTKLAT